MTPQRIMGPLIMPRSVLAEKTVKNYVSSLLAKLGMERRTQAASYATRLDEQSAHQQRTDETGT